ncbi:4-hydroxyphenylacetate 3-hydroxylase family protein [Streptomyces sp. CRN 30]|uniref:4-hydroxyphenylacetate 3-hydroxylase family protein n=1 Tax=Streptomyces sp. CRN 30 TaxID=3075613 RepID=UPI002A818667|nr:4-hydroxyphenylacetate 3-hydroxylase family protein [Streptomyces sp. CRN 30]
MIRTGQQYLDSLSPDRQIWIDGARVRDVTVHPQFAPVVALRARIHDLAHEAATRDVMTYTDPETGERHAVANKPPVGPQDWHDKGAAVDAVLDAARGVVTRVGDETVGEMWSLLDCLGRLDDLDPRFTDNIRRHLARTVTDDLFHVSANTDVKGDRSKRPQDQDPDLVLRVVRETDSGVVVRGAKYETAAAYADQAFTKPTVADWGGAERSDHAVGFVVDMNAPGLKFICRTGFAGRAAAEDYPLSHRVDEIDTLVVFDDVHIPWEDVLYYRHTEAADLVRSTLHRYSALPFTYRNLRLADLMIGAALWNVKQTGLEHRPAVQEKLARLACYREGIHAHLTAAIALGTESPGGLFMPQQSLLYSGRVLAGAQLPQMMHLARELCGGQICLTPDAAAFDDPDIGGWLDKYYTVNDSWVADDRRKLLAFARDLLNSDHAGHRLTFQLFAQSPPFAQLGAVYRSFDWDGPLDLVRDAAGLSDRVLGEKRE